MNRDTLIIGEVDFREKPSSCTENPVIKLKRLVKKLKDGEAVKVFADFNSTPKRFFELLARKENLKLEILSEGETSEILLVKSSK